MSKRDEIDDLLRRAMAAIQNEHAQDAARLAQKVLDMHPSHPNALHFYGYALLMQDRADEAIAPLEKAFRALRDPAVETQLAIALRKAGRTDDALSRLTRAAKRVPIFPAAIHELAFLLHSLGRDDEAIAALNRGIEATPLMIELHLLLGWIFQDRRELEKAKAAYGRALAIAPQHPNALTRMGLLLKDVGDFKAAAECFSRATTVTPNDPQARLNLGQCLLEGGQPDAAYACLRATTNFGPKLYGDALKVLLKSARGRFWLRPSAAVRFFKGEKT